MEHLSVLHQPKSCDFSKRSFRKKAVRRSFQAPWFDRWHWLHHVESIDLALCFNGTPAKKQKKTGSTDNVGNDFICCSSHRVIIGQVSSNW